MNELSMAVQVAIHNIQLDTFRNYFAESLIGRCRKCIYESILNRWPGFLQLQNGI